VRDSLLHRRNPRIIESPASFKSILRPGDLDIRFELLKQPVSIIRELINIKIFDFIRARIMKGSYEDSIFWYRKTKLLDLEANVIPIGHHSENPGIHSTGPPTTRAAIIRGPEGIIGAIRPMPHNENYLR
jgi:hypothetical protein